MKPSLLLTLFAFALLPAISSRADDAAIHITGAVSKPVEWTTAQLRETFAADLHAVDYTAKDGKHTSRCIPLLSILKSAGVDSAVGKNPAADPKAKNQSLHLAIIIRGRDGYVAVFSLAELLPEIGNKPAWVAIDQDNSSLSDRDTPAKLIVPADAKPGRWVHGIDIIQVIDESPTATRP